MEKPLRIGQAHEPSRRVVLIEAGVKRAGEAKRRPLGNYAVGSHFALGADQGHLVAHHRADRSGQFVPQHYGWKLSGCRRIGLRLEGLYRARRGGFEQVAHREFLVGKNAFNQRAPVASAPRDQYLLV